MKGKVALVTGAAHGLGRAIASALVEGGAFCVLADVDGQAGEAAAAELGERAHFVSADVQQEPAARMLVEQTVARFGRLDVAVNNAGINGPIKPFWEIEEADFERVAGINIDGVWFGLQAQIREMRRSRGGVIINTASVRGVRTFGSGSALYSASKRAILGLTRSAALECGPEIRINAICPGAFDTRVTRETLSEGSAAEAILAMTPLARIGTPEELGRIVLWLCSNEAGFIHGQGLVVDGGMLS